MYNVLDLNDKIIKVELIDIKNHRHLSGRFFNQDDNVEFVTIKKVTKKTK